MVEQSCSPCEENTAMANSSAFYGFMPYGRVDGGSPTWELEQTSINSSDTNAFFTGDLVGHSSATGQGAFIANATTTIGSGVPPFGVFWGCEFFSAAASRVVWSRHYPGSVGSNAANGVTRAWVISDPNTLFKSKSGGTFAITDVGLHTIIVTSNSSLGNTTTGQSAMLLSTATTTNSSAPWKIIDLLANRSVSGTPGTDAAAFNEVIVAPNNWERQAGTIGVST